MSCSFFYFGVFNKKSRMNLLLKKIVYRSGYILYYLFYGCLGILIIMNLFFEDYLTKEIFYIFFFIAGMYVGGKITYYSLKCKSIR